MKSQKSLFVFLVIFVVYSLMGCDLNRSVNVQEAMSTGVIAAPSETSVIRGYLISTSGDEALSFVLVRLALIYGNGTESFYVLNESESPGTYTNEKGEFIFEGIVPGQYALLFADANNNYLAIQETKDKIVTVDARKSEIVDLGEIFVDLDNQER